MQLRDRARRRAALGFAGVLLTALTLTVGGPGLGPDAGATPPALNVVPTNLPFGEATLGTYVGPLKLTIGNGSASEDTTTFVFSGPAPNDFAWTFGGNCPTPLDAAGKVIPMPAYSSCTVDFYFFPGALGARNATLSLIDTANSGAAITLSGTGGIGYYQVSTTGSVGYAGDAGFYGDASTLKLNHPIVGMAQTGDNGGYWLAASDGGVFNYGDAPFFGSAGALPLNKPIVGMAATYDATGPTGYWLVASDGGIFTYGQAQFYGSTGSMHLNKPIVGMASTPDGLGYWLVASDGGIFSYGDAQFQGSAGALSLAQPIVGMAAMPDGGGYWFTAADGGLFNYGTAPFLGAGTGLGLGQVVGMATDGEPTVQAATDVPAIRPRMVRPGGSSSASRGMPRGLHFAGG